MDFVAPILEWLSHSSVHLSHYILSDDTSTRGGEALNIRQCREYSDLRYVDYGEEIWVQSNTRVREANKC